MPRGSGSRQGVGNLCSAKGHLGIYNVIHGPYNIIHLKIRLLHLVKYLINTPNAAAGPDE